MAFQQFRKFGATFTLAVASMAVAHAGTIFIAQGEFEDGSALSGTVTIDTVAGLFTDINLVAGAPTNLKFFTNISQGFDPTPGAFYTVFVSNLDGSFDFAFGLPVLSLIGYTGGPICSLATLSPPICLASNVVEVGPNIWSPYLSFGSLFQSSTDASAVPEPSYLSLLGPALAGLWITWQRSRSTQQA